MAKDTRKIFFCYSTIMKFLELLNVLMERFLEGAEAENIKTLQGMRAV